MVEFPAACGGTFCHGITESFCISAMSMPYMATSLQSWETEGWYNDGYRYHLGSVIIVASYLITLYSFYGMTKQPQMHMPWN